MADDNPLGLPMQRRRGKGESARAQAHPLFHSPARWSGRRMEATSDNDWRSEMQAQVALLSGAQRSTNMRREGDAPLLYTRERNWRSPLPIGLHLGTPRSKDGTCHMVLRQSNCFGVFERRGLPTLPFWLGWRRPTTRLPWGLTTKNCYQSATRVRWHNSSL